MYTLIDFRYQTSKKTINNLSKIDQKSIKNQPKIHQKSTKIGLGAPQSRLGGVLEASWRLRYIFLLIFDHLSDQLGSILESKTEPLGLFFQ